MPRSELHSVLDMSNKDGENGKRSKREIANENERRRMQNINAGFLSLRAQLPHRHDGEKLSKAAILQHTANYIFQLEHECSKLFKMNSELNYLAGGSGADVSSGSSPDWKKMFSSELPDCPSCKRRKYENAHRLDIDSSPLGGDGSSTESSSEQEQSKSRGGRSSTKQNGKSNSNNESASLFKQLVRLEKLLEEERRMRSLLEEELSYHNKNASNLNGQQSVADHATSDEVEMCESIEIEMQSCPASPSAVMSITNADQSTDSMVYIANQHASGISHMEVNHQQKQRGQKQNAIALPIDVPFVAESNQTEKEATNTTGSNQVMYFLDPTTNAMIPVQIDPSTKVEPTTVAVGGSTTSVMPQVLQLVSSNGQPVTATTLDGKSSSMITSMQTGHDASVQDELNMQSRQNLNTIVEAIRHLEGDHLFNESPTKVNVKDSPVKEHANSMNESNNSTADSLIHPDAIKKEEQEKGVQEVPIDAKGILTSLANGTPVLSGTLVVSSTEQAGSSQPRPMIIQRPNVIVAHSAEN